MAACAGHNERSCSQAVRPKLRSDLAVLSSSESGGTPVVVIKDPVSDRFFRLSPNEHRFLSLFDGTLTVEEALEKLRATGRYFSNEEADQVVNRAAHLGLMLGTGFGTAKFQKHLKDRSNEARKLCLYSQIYFLFIPIWNADVFLQRTLWVLRLLVNKWTAGAVALLIPGALYLIVAGISKIDRELLSFSNWENILQLWLTIALVKLVHELAHAYVAKSFGLRVPQMGVAFLIFFPCLYCNTTDALSLADRKQRMAISAAESWRKRSWRYFPSMSGTSLGRELYTRWLST